MINVTMKKMVMTSLLVVTLLVSFLFYHLEGRKANTFYGDALGYYLYLPATFIFHNIKHMDELPPGREFPHWYTDQIKYANKLTEKGYVVNQYTYGVALMELPFFLIAHGYEKMSGMPANGYSKTYDHLIKVSSMFYAFLGLLLTFKILKKYYSDLNSLIGTLCIFLGTNLFWFSLHQAGMAHVPLCFLYALLIYLSIKVHDQPKAFIFILLGLTAGIITIIRPTDILCLLIPLLYNVYNRNTLAQKVLFIKQNLLNLCLLAAAFLIPLIPQMLYWEPLSGHYIFYNYGRQIFDWKHPKIIEGIFYGQNGWLIYSPLLIFAIAGMFLYKYIKQWIWCLWVVLPIYVYIIYSWYCYYYINGFGSRPMIHLYPLLAIPLTAFIQYISTRRIFLKLCYVAIVVFFVAISLSFTVQQAKGILLSEGSNLTYDYEILFKNYITYDDLVCMDSGDVQPDRNKLQAISTIECINFEDSVSIHYKADPTMQSKYVYETGEDEYAAKSIKTVYGEKMKGAKWLKCSGRFMCPLQPEYYKHLLVLGIQHEDKFLIWKSCSIENKIGLKDCKKDEIVIGRFEINKWDNVSFFVKIPDKIKDGDKIELLLWNIGKKDIYMDNLCLELYR